MTRRPPANPPMVDIDVIIPVHSVSRPLRRAVDSVLSGGLPGVKALVICHNLSREEIIEASGLTPSADLEFHEFRDSIRSPAGPRNHGISVSRASYVAFLDSDDLFDADALRLWADEAGAHGHPDLLVGQVHSEQARFFSTPCPRVGRRTGLRPHRDLLNDRTAPQGVLVRRQLLRPPASPRFDSQVPIGEDLVIGLYLWNAARSVVYSRFRAGYQLKADAGDRLTSVAYPVGTKLYPVRNLLEQDWPYALDARSRGALAKKLIRFELVGLSLEFAREDRLGRDELAEISVVLRMIEDFYPAVALSLPLWESRFVKYVRDEDHDGLLGMLNSRSKWARAAQSLLPGHLSGVGAPEQGYIRAFRTVIGGKLLRGPRGKPR